MKVTDRLKHIVFFLGAAGIPVLAPAMPTAVAPTRAPSDVGKSCVASDPDFLCLGLKYVVYEDSDLHPIVSKKTVAANVAAVNSIWRQCKIGFQVDEYIAQSPAQAGLPADTSDFSDLDRIRETYGKSSSLLVVTTYKWRRDGNLGHTPANAWTKMPGSGVYGVVLEEKVGAFPNIIAHELGHYLNLYHSNERSEVMNAVIYNSSSAITQEQCSTARASVFKWWGNVVRRLPAAISDQRQLAKETTQKSKKG